MSYTTINKSSDYFNTVTYSGSETPQTITGVNFSADMAWFKNRTGTAAGGNIYDTVRGISDGWLYTNETAASNNSGQPQITLNSDGYVLNSGYDLINDGSSTYVSWNWKANGAGSANTAGSINSTVSVNTTAGFSIVKWTGTGSASTVGHGLGVAPKMIIMKRTSGAVNDWVVYHASVGNNKALFLNATNAPDTDSAYFNDTSPTSSVFSVKSGQTNNNYDNQIAYCFAEKQGYSKFRSYAGNGNANGTFIYTGFKPAFVMIKRTDTTNNWYIHDNKRLGYNVSNSYVKANASSVESATTDIDILSNGFKCRSTGNGHNNSSGTYIYAAFAEAPLVGSNNVPCTAR